MTNPNLEQLLEKLREEVNQSLANFKGTLTSGYGKEAIQEKLINLLKSFLPETKQDKFDIEVRTREGDSVLIIEPNNLYTALILNDDYLPYLLVEGREEISTKKGLYRYDKGLIVFIPNDSKEITIDLTFTE